MLFCYMLYNMAKVSSYYFIQHKKKHPFNTLIQAIKKLENTFLAISTWSGFKSEQKNYTALKKTMKSIYFFKSVNLNLVLYYGHTV